MDGLDVYIDDYSQARSDCARHRARRWCRAATSSIRRRRASTRRASSRTSPPDELGGAEARAAADAPPRADAPKPPALRRCRRRADAAAARRRRRSEPSAEAPRPTRSDAPDRRRAMSLADKHAAPLLVQRHDAARRGGARARARARRRARRAHDALPEGARARSPATPRATCVVACTQEARLFGDVAEEGGQDADDPLRQHPRDRRLVGRSARRDAQDRRAARAGRRCPSREPVPRVAYRSEGQLLIVGPADAALHWAEALSAAARASPCSSPAARPAPSCRRSATIPVYSGTLDRALAAGSARSRSQWAQENPIDLDLCTRCNACMRRVSRAGDRLRATRSTSTAARRIASASPRAARSARSTSRARDVARAASASISCSTCSATPQFAHAPAAAGLSRAGRRPGRAGAGGRRARGDDRRVREAEVLRVQGVDLRAQPLAASPAATSASTSARRRRSAPTAITSRSSRTFAWAAAPARPCARRAR